MAFTVNIVQTGETSNVDPIEITLSATPTSNSIMVLFLVYWNAGSSGEDIFDGGSTLKDAVANTWTSPQSVVQSPTNSQYDGIIIRAFTATNTNGLSSGHPISVEGQVSDVGTEVIYILYELLADNSISFNTSNTSQNNGLYPTITTPSLTSYDVVLAISAANTDGVRNYDTDNTNGSWVNGNKLTNSTRVIEFISQYKKVTGDGMQTFNPTFTNDGTEPAPEEATLYLVFSEAAPPPPASSFYLISTIMTN